jgi:hypothetical protein
LLVGLDGLHVLEVLHERNGLLVVVESPPGPMDCSSCGVVAHSHGRREVGLVDAPCFGRPVRIVWRKRTWRCEESACATRSFTEQNEQIAVTAGAADDPGVLVGDRPDPRTRLDPGRGPSTGYDLEHDLVLDPAAAEGNGC